ncbi:MAG: hypothetical protein GF350_11630 [Chitinivibrionales bacterium]|nr:hypothetical protein [Chitinivibrionales bacterium]
MTSSHAAFTTDDICDLLIKNGKPCVSVYMQTSETGEATKQHPIRLKNLHNRAREKLSGIGMKGRKAEEYLRPLDDQVGLMTMQQHACHGMGFFINEDIRRFIHLPDTTEDLVVVGDRFHIIPLLRSAAIPMGFYVLRLGRKDVSLFRCTCTNIEVATPEDMPSTIDEALLLDLSEKGVQFKAATPHGGQPRPGTFHGQGGGENNGKNRIMEYFRTVDDCIKKTVEQPALLITAGLPSVRTLYHKVNTYPYIVDDGITENPFDCSGEELHRKALAVVDPLMRNVQDRFVEEYNHRAGHADEGAVNRIDAAIRLACEGRMRALFVDPATHIWGRYDQVSGELSRHAHEESGDMDLLNITAAETLAHKGDVFTLEPGKIPGGGVIAGVTRY